MAMATSTTATDLHHEVRGSGPAVLLIPGATGDAGHFTRTAERLANEFTVITYDRRGRGESGDTLPYALGREIEVLRLLVRGLSNKEIGARLYVSSKTVGHHVQHIYDKIGVSSRAAAALFAMEAGLI